MHARGRRGVLFFGTCPETRERLAKAQRHYWNRYQAVNLRPMTQENKHICAAKSPFIAAYVVPETSAKRTAEIAITLGNINAALQYSQLAIMRRDFMHLHVYLTL